MKAFKPEAPTPQNGLMMLPTNCLSELKHFVELALKGLKRFFLSALKSRQRKRRCSGDSISGPQLHMGIAISLKSCRDLSSFNSLKFRQGLVKGLMSTGSCILKIEHLWTFIKLIIHALNLPKYYNFLFLLLVFPYRFSISTFIADWFKPQFLIKLISGWSLNSPNYC